MRLGLRILFVLAPVVIALHASAQTADLLPCIDAGASKALSKQRIEEALALQRQHVARFDATAAGLPAQARFICARGYVGVFLSRLERDSEALAILEPLVEEGRQKLGTDHPDTLNVELLLAMAYGKATRYDAEIKMLQALRPRVAKRYGAKSLEMANVLDSLATAYNWLRNFADAVPLDEESLAITLAWIQRPGNCPDRNQCRMMVAVRRSALAESLNQVGRPAEALPQIEQALSEMNAVHGPYHPDTLNARLVLASSHSRLGENDKALAMDRETLDLAEHHLGNDHPITRKARNNLAVVLFATGKTNESIELERQQLAKLRELRGTNNPETLLALVNLSERLLRAGEIDRALPLLEDAIGAMLRTRDGLGFDDRLTLAWQENWRRLVDAYIAVLLSKKRPGDAFLTVEFFKAQLLADRLSLDPAERGLPAESRIALRKARRSLGTVEQSLALKRSLGQPTSREEAARSELLGRIAEFQLSIPTGISLPSAQNLPDWYHTLSRDEPQSTRLSYFFIGKRIAVFVNHGSRVDVIGLGDGEAVKETIEAYRLSMRAKASGKAGTKPPTLWARPGGGYLAGSRPQADAEEVKDVRLLAHYLSDVLLKPLAGYLKGRTRIIISPDQVLAHVPFDALTVEGARLGDQAEITLIPSFALHAYLAQRKEAYRSTQRAQFLGFGGADYQRVTKVLPNLLLVREKAPTLTPMDVKVIAQNVRKDPSKLSQAFAAQLIGFPDLPGTLAEVRGIAERFPGRGAMYFTGEQAAEATLNRLAAEGRLAGFRALHFATHGFLSDDEPGLSAIVLSQVNRAPGTDGYLTVAEISSLELRTDLVVISACDSGVGKVKRGEGLLGMSYALFQAGTIASLVTLWPIPDADSVRLMLHFYEEWNADAPTAQALAKTKRWALRNGVSAEAVDAFVLFGL